MPVGNTNFTVVPKPSAKKPTNVPIEPETPPASVTTVRGLQAREEIEAKYEAGSTDGHSEGNPELA